MSKLQSKVALVTGASKGIGAGIAKELAATGAPRKIRVNSVNPGATLSEGTKESPSLANGSRSIHTDASFSARIFIVVSERSSS